MSYPIGRVLAYWSRLWLDTQQEKPDQVSDAPVQPVAVVNSPYESSVVAFGSVVDNVGAGAITPIAWRYYPTLLSDDAGVAASLNALPESFIWRVDLLYGRSAGALGTVGINPHDDQSNLLGEVDSIVPNASTQNSPAEWIVTDEIVQPIVLPFGGLIRLKTDAASTNGRLFAIATGFLRGSLFSPG